MEQREPAIFIVVGGMGVGKSYRTKKELTKYVKNGRKCLVYDVNYPLERTYERIKTVSDKLVHKLKKAQARRVVPIHPNGKPYTLDEKIETLKTILNTYTSGCVVLEDINNYVLDPNKMEEVIGVIVTVRHRGLDVIIHYQTLAAVPTRFRRVARFFRLHYQPDNIDEYQERVNNYEIFKLAQLVINDEYLNGNKYFYCYVDNFNLKITGVSQVQFEKACLAYLRLKPKIYRDIALEYGLGKPTPENMEKATDIFVKQHQHYLG